ncbi:MAG: tRNA dihydrouridine synthase DusB [Bacilli bacterium]|nr:tRNA dihydrouridine synthase DusB [Bacilli bacterium]
MKIGNIEIKSKVVLAPMAGISNPAYIKICEEMGVGYAITELLSAEAIVRNNKKTFDMLKGIDKINIPVAVQIFGSNPSTMAEASSILVRDYNIKIIDINMGCPVPKVALKNEAGSGLLRNLDKIYEIISKVKEAVDVPVTVKIRSGWDQKSINAVEVAKICESAGVSAITIHPRTRNQGYSGKADWNIIKEVKESVSIPVIGNGDITDIYKAKEMLDTTKCDLIMIGRGLLGNPWLIKEINAYLEKGIILNKPTSKEKIDMCLKHLDYLSKIKPEKLVCLEIRSHIAWYLKGIQGGKNIKEKIYATNNLCDIISILNKFKEELL